MSLIFVYKSFPVANGEKTDSGVVMSIPLRRFKADRNGCVTWNAVRIRGIPALCGGIALNASKTYLRLGVGSFAKKPEALFLVICPPVLIKVQIPVQRGDGIQPAYRLVLVRNSVASESWLNGLRAQRSCPRLGWLLA